MQALVLGGSADGKSEFAENLAISIKGETDALIYIATMKPIGEEALERIARHRKMRAKKGFETIECYTDVEKIILPSNSIILLECLSNLLANELFPEDSYRKGNVDIEKKILTGISALYQKAKHLVLVSNDIFSDGIDYGLETVKYQQILASLNENIAVESNKVVEVVCGIPVFHKGGNFENH